jgi:GTP-binding protein
MARTTLVDALLHQSGIFPVERAAWQNGSWTRTNSSGSAASRFWRRTRPCNYHDHLINIVDTPGHADFGGEVERTLSMVDGVMLLVDASEGPLPQTRFVLRKALERRLTPMVVINKIDRSDARTQDVLNEVYDLFIDLDATEDQLDFPVLYTNAGRARRRRARGAGEDLRPLFDAVIKHIPPPRGSATRRFRRSSPISTRATTSAASRSAHLQRPRQGRRSDRRLQARRLVQRTVVTKLYTFEGLKRVDATSARPATSSVWPASRTS